MTLLQALILGIVQGLTEFLPVSSSAHLVLVPHLLGWNLAKEFIFPFDVLVQLGTLVAAVFYFRKDLVEIISAVFRGIRSKKLFEETPARVGWLAILATIPAGLIGLLLKDKVEAAFKNPTATSLFLFVTAVLLIIAEFLGKRRKGLEKLSWLDALCVGFFQALSIFPGISRSGSTISGGMTIDLDRKSASQFSFILAIPIFLAAGLLGIKDLLAINNLSVYLPSLIIGFLAAAIVGFFSIRWFLGYVTNHSLLPFAGYCVMLAAGTLAFTLLGSSLPVSSVPVVSETKATSVPSSPVYKVAFVSDLEWMLPAMVDCQNKQPGLNILFSQEAFESGKQTKSTIALTYGEVPGLSTTVFQIGNELLLPAVNRYSPLIAMTPALAQEIFSGQIKTWEQAIEACPDCFFMKGLKGDINIYAFTPGSNLDNAISEFFVGGKPLSTNTRLAPNSKAIREVLKVDMQGLAVLPKGWFDITLQEAKFKTTEDQAPSIPVLAYTSAPLNESLKTWLACVQEGFK